MYKLLIWSLLAFVPFTGVRMVCIDRPAAGLPSAADQGNDCDQFCLRSKAPAAYAPRANVECMLFAEGSVLVVVSGVATLSAQAPIRFELRHPTYEIEVGDRYLSPVLPHHTPPPKI